MTNFVDFPEPKCLTNSPSPSSRCRAAPSLPTIWPRRSIGLRRRHEKAPTSFACPSSSRRSISASEKTRLCSISRSRFPARARRSSPPLLRKRAPGLYHNTAAIFDSDGVLRGIYRKMHIPDDPLYYEKFYFTPGDLGFKAFDTSAGKIGTLVCWDQWYPEGARLTALQGASILFYPTAIGWHPTEKAEFGEAQLDAWRTIQRAHAIANGVYVGVVNRVGFETGDIRGNSVPGKGLEFWGGSFFCDPFGRVLAEASHDKEEILLGEVDLHQLEDIRRNWPFLRDRRIDSYAPITSRMLDGK